MKKLLYIIAITVVAATSLLSCTEEVVKPKEQTAGGNVIRE